MSRCEGCAYYYVDVDDEGRPLGWEYCHILVDTWDECPVEFEEYLDWSREEM